MEDYPLLYKKDSKGNIRVWRMQRDGAKYRTVAGLIDGDQVTSKWTTAKPKNTGRANATTAEQQAHREVTAKYVKKKEQGAYHEDIADVDKGAGYFQPMLAETYKATKFEFRVGVFAVQPKLDGIRCIAKRDGLWTRKGKPILSCPHVIEDLKPVFEAYPHLVIDGELYNHELRNDFQKITSLVRKQRCNADIYAETARLVEYHVYDVGEAKRSFLKRWAFLEAVDARSGGSVLKVMTLEPETQAEVDDFHATCISQGYEGSMIRDMEGEYQIGKRSPFLLKRKDFDTNEFVIEDVIEGEGNRSGMAGKLAFTCDGGEFTAAARGGVTYYKELLQNKSKYIGCEATVRHLGWTDDGKPRHGVVIDIHDGQRSD